MEATKENIDGLKKLGFKENKKGQYFYMDLKCNEFKGHLFFKYDSKDLPLIQEVESIDKIIQGIYEYKFLQ